MIKIPKFLLLLAVALIGSDVTAQTIRHQELLAGPEWSFLGADDPLALPQLNTAEFNRAAWQPVTVPHVFQTREHFYAPVLGWYRREVPISSESAGKHLYLVFEGAASVADVYVNGQHLGQHRGAYTRFVMDATEALKPGQSNELAVRVNNDKQETQDCLPDGSRLYKVWGGLYRKVWLMAVDPLHIDPTDYASPGVYITPQQVTETNVDFSVRVLLRNTASMAQNAQVHATLLDPDGATVWEFSTATNTPSGGRAQVEFAGQLARPRLWGPGNPNLYQLKVDLLRDGQVVDEVTQATGFRNLIFQPETGRVSLNGKPIILLGANLHQEIESKASAMSDDDFATDYAFMQDLGFNFIRLPHYPHAQLEYDTCDRLGILCWAENGHSNKDAPGSTADQITTEMVKQNYNHPSIAVWSVGNEAGELVADREVPVVKALDPTRLVVVANMKCTNADFHGINNYGGWYGGTNLWSFPRKGYVTETGAGGVISIHQDYDSRAFKFNRYEPEEYQQLLAEARFQQCVGQNDGAIGMFAWWCLRDLNDVKYKQPIGWNTKGLVTYAGFKKDIYYLYRCFLRTNEPTVHLTSKQYFIRAGKVDNGIKAYASTATLTLTLNGQMVSTLPDGAYTQGDGHHVNHVFYWPVPLHTGRNTVAVSDGAGHDDAAVVYFYGANGLPELPLSQPLITDLQGTNTGNIPRFMDLPVAAQWPIYYDLDSTADNSFAELPSVLEGARWIAQRRITKPGQENELSFKVTRPVTVYVMATRQSGRPANLDAAFAEITPPGLLWRDNDLMLVPAQLYSRTAKAGETVQFGTFDRDSIVLLKE